MLPSCLHKIPLAAAAGWARNEIIKIGKYCWNVKQILVQILAVLNRQIGGVRQAAVALQLTQSFSSKWKKKNRFTQFELVAADLQINNTRSREILSQIDTNTEKYEFGCFFHAYTKYHWQPQLVGQEMHSLELANTGGK